MSLRNIYDHIAVSHMAEPYFKDCSYSLSDDEILPYLCLKSETCCDYGCCITTFRKMAQFWYFWLILIFACMGCMACIHYYRKLRDERILLRAVQHRRRRDDFANRFLVDERCIYHVQNASDVSFPAQVHSEEMHSSDEMTFPSPSAPPDYCSIVEKDAALYTEPPPKYSSVYRNCLQDNDTKLEVDIPGATSNHSKNDKPEN